MKKLLFTMSLFFTFISMASAGKTLKFFIERPNDIPGTVVYEIKHSNTGKIEQVEITGDYFEYTFPDNVTGARVQEISRPEYFKSNDSIYNFYFTSTSKPEIHYQEILSNILYTINSFYYSLKDQNKINVYSTSYNILDENKEFVKKVNDNFFVMTYGIYFLQDINTLKLYDFNYLKKTIDIYRYVIDGLKVDAEVTSICKEDSCFEFTQEENLVTFPNDYIYPGTYLINDKEFTLDENPLSIAQDSLNIIELKLTPDEPEVVEPEEKEPDPKPVEPDTDDNHSNGEEEIPSVPKEEENIPEEEPKEEIPVPPEETEEELEEEVKDYFVSVPNTGLEVHEIIYYLKKYYL